VKDQLLRSWFYRPERGFFVTPDQLGLAYQDVIFRAKDGTGLHGWFIPGGDSPGPETRPVTILFMHGVAGNISHRAENAAALRANLNAHVFLFDYRGYGRSSGEPSEEGTYLDAEAAFEVLCQRDDVDWHRIILFGHSLGGAVAVELAARLGERVCGLIVESSFTSARDVARLMLPIIPESAVPDSYNSLAKMAQIRVPLLVTHAEEDSLLPLDMGRSLYEGAGDPKTFYVVPGADHADIYQAGGSAYFDVLRGFAQACARQDMPEPAPSSP
jgi:pimeloyl-ACP methyl ester carboxylesterase